MKMDPAVSSSAPTPLTWRLGIAAATVALAGAAYLGRDLLGPRGVAPVGALCFIGVAAIFSANLRAVSWRTIGWGLALQLLLALFVLKFEVFGYHPGRALFDTLGGVIREFLAFTD